VQRRAETQAASSTLPCQMASCRAIIGSARGCWFPWPKSLHAFASPGDRLPVQFTEVRMNVTERVNYCIYFGVPTPPK
jgi:hypothetical protein